MLNINSRSPLLAILLLSGCGSGASNSYTLYRNSSFDVAIRVHWATFDADESDPAYNLNNCLMASRILNANVAANAKAEGKELNRSLGFWCEAGPYREQGSIPNDFQAEFPTDT